jgi:hypothetical protein
VKYVIVPNEMSAVRLRRTGLEYRNSVKGPLAASFLSNINATSGHAHILRYVMNCEKMAVTDMSFHQRAATETVKEGNSVGVI